MLWWYGRPNRWILWWHSPGTVLWKSGDLRCGISIIYIIYTSTALCTCRYLHLDIRSYVFTLYLRLSEHLPNQFVTLLEVIVSWSSGLLMHCCHMRWEGWRKLLLCETINTEEASSNRLVMVGADKEARHVTGDTNPEVVTPLWVFTSPTSGRCYWNVNWGEQFVQLLAFSAPLDQDHYWHGRRIILDYWAVTMCESDCNYRSLYYFRLLYHNGWSKASNENLWRFYNHREGPYWGY